MRVRLTVQRPCLYRGLHGASAYRCSPDTCGDGAQGCADISGGSPTRGGAGRDLGPVPVLEDGSGVDPGRADGSEWGGAAPRVRRACGSAAGGTAKAAITQALAEVG